MGQIISVLFLETFTFSYLLTELQLFFWDQEEMPWSQKRGRSSCGWVNMWHSVGQRDAKGNCWGFWARWFFLIRESHVEKYFQTWKSILGECDAGHGNSFLRVWEQWGGQSITEMWNWSAALILSIDWINSSNCFIQTGCYMRKKFYCLGTLCQGFLYQTEATNCLFHSVYLSNTGSLFSLLSCWSFCIFVPLSCLWGLFI